MKKKIEIKNEFSEDKKSYKVSDYLSMDEDEQAKIKVESYSQDATPYSKLKIKQDLSDIKNEIKSELNTD
jgi:hypothetical protein